MIYNNLQITLKNKVMHNKRFRYFIKQYLPMNNLKYKLMRNELVII